MRGKLRDKRAAGKRGAYSREDFERRRPYKRDSRAMLRIDQQEDEFDLDFDLELEEGEYDEEEDSEELNINLPRKK